MKKIIALFLALAMALVACGKKPTDENNQGQLTQGGSSAPEGAVTDETKLGESVSYYTDGEYLYLKIKTSYEFDAHDAYIDIVNPGFYLTRDSEFITQSIFGSGRDFDEEFDREWFDGIYVFKLDNNMITDLASDESEWAPGTWTMMLYEGESRVVIGQWLIVLEGGGKYHFAFSDSWLRGAGEDRKVKGFDSLQDEAASWFSFHAYSEDWSEFFFDGYYLEATDPQGYDGYYLMICPEGDYATYEEADAADFTYSGITEKCPYKFSLENYCVPDFGKYTIVLAKMGGNVEVQFTAEKVNAAEWKMDFSNARCLALESKYAK